MKFLSKIIFSWSFTLMFIMLFAMQISFGQTSTTTAGNWNTASNWSPAAVPGGGTDVNVNHAMTINTNIATTSGDYTIYSPIIDAAGGTAYTLSVGGTGGNQGNFDVRASSTFEGAASINGNGTLTVRSGVTLTLGPTVFANNCIVVIESGATLIINGDLTNNNNSTGITINGAIQINGNFTGGNGSIVAGTGTFNTTGTITNNGSSTVLGSNNSCTTGPCSGNNLCVSNTIAAAQTICSGQTPAGLTGSLHGGYTYKWQSSTTSSSAGFSDIPGAASQNYSPGSLTATTWYRRIVSSGGCVATSVALQVTVNPNLPVSVSIAANPSGTICSGTSVTFTATPTNGGTTPAYQWKLNGANVGSNSVNYTNAALANGDVVTCVLTSNATCPTGSPATSGSITMTVVASSGAWLGSTSTDWNTASNWCGGVPSAATNVIINSGSTNMPSITAAGAVCNQLTINSGATLTISSLGALSAKGDIINNGTLTSNGTVTLNGASLQDVSSTNFTNLVLNNAAGCNLSGAVNVIGVLTLTSGQMTTNGNLTVDLNTGAISGTGTGSISGNVTTSKSVNSTRYHYIASPLNGATVAEWNDDKTVNFGQYGNLFYYDETISNPDDQVGWTAVGSLATPLTPMIGYALFFDAATILDVTGTYAHTTAPSNVAITNTASSDLTKDGWNLVGNPYPSTIDWNAASGWTKTGVLNAIYFWDPSNDRYATYVGGIGTFGATRYIPSMQAFWVRNNVSGSSGTLGMNNNVRTTTSNPSLWRVASTNNIVSLSASNGTNSDETIIRFTEDAHVTFDSELDGYKLKNDGNTPNLFTVLDEDEYSVNSLPDTCTNITIPLHLKAATAGSYTISADNLEDFDANYEVTLEDKLLGSLQDLRDISTYTFQVNSGDDADRFQITFRQSAVSSVNNAQSVAKVKIRSAESMVYVDFTNISSNNGDISVYNLLGRPLAEIKNANISSGKFSMDFPGESGIYLVKVAVGNEIYTEKVYLK